MTERKKFLKVERPYKDHSELVRYKTISICQCVESRGPDGGVCGKCGNAILSFSEEKLIQELLTLRERNTTLEKYQEATGNIEENLAECVERAENSEAELLKLKEGYNKLIDAWDSLKGGQRYNVNTIQKWLIKQMQPDIENSRELLSRKSPNP